MSSYRLKENFDEEEDNEPDFELSYIEEQAVSKHTLLLKQTVIRFAARCESRATIELIQPRIVETGTFGVTSSFVSSPSFSLVELTSREESVDKQGSSIGFFQLPTYFSFDRQ